MSPFQFDPNTPQRGRSQPKAGPRTSRVSIAAFQLKRRAPPCLIVCETLRSRGFHLPETFTQAPQTPEQQEATHAPKLTLHSFFALASTSRASGLAPPDPDSPETIMSSDPTSDCTRTSQDTQTEGGGEEEDDNAGVEEDDDVVVELLASSRAGDGMGGTSSRSSNHFNHTFLRSPLH